MTKIIISYRRSDSAAITGRIFDRLVSHYGPHSVFMDIDNLPFGVDFRDHLREVLGSCDMLVAVIGGDWVGQAADGTKRINSNQDWVRIEVATALQRGIPVVPMLVGGTPMPEPHDLPDDLRELAFRNAAEVDAGRDFHAHMDRVVRSMDRVLAPRVPAGEGSRAGVPGATREMQPGGSQLSATPAAAWSDRFTSDPVALLCGLSALSGIAANLVFPASVWGSGGSAVEGSIARFGVWIAAVPLVAVLVLCEYRWGRRRWYNLLGVAIATYVAWIISYIVAYMSIAYRLGSKLGGDLQSTAADHLFAGMIAGALGAALAGVSLTALRTRPRMLAASGLGALLGLLLYGEVLTGLPVLFVGWQLGFAIHLANCIRNDLRSRL